MSTYDPAELIEHADGMRRLALRLLGQDADADDAVQEAWLATLHAPPDADGPARPWLDVVTRNAALQSLRRGRRRAALERRLAPEAELPTAEEAVERAEIHRRAVDALLALSEPYRGTLLLRYFEDLSGEEIARREGVPAATVRTRLKRGLDELRRRLAAREDDGDWRAACLLLAGRPAPRRWSLPLGPVLLCYAALLAAGLVAHSGEILRKPSARPARVEQQRLLDQLGYGSAPDNDQGLQELGYTNQDGH